jgi:hypothetical protein
VERRAVGSQVVLLVVAFAATLLLLVAGWRLLGRVGADGPRASGPPGPSGLALGSPGASGPLIQPTPVITLPPPAGPDETNAPTITLTGAGDIADCSLAGAGQTAAIVAAQTGWVFTVGDNAYENGSTADFTNCYAPTWGRVLDRTILPVAGNHDWNTDGAAGYRAYFGDRAAPDGVTWYSMTAGSWHVIVLDSDCAKVGGCDASSPQGRWLAADLRSNPVRCTVAFWHHPRFSSGEHGDDPEVAPFWEMLHAAHADLVINGHDHDYERFAPMDPSGTEERPGGIREIVIGTGGAELRSFTHAAPGTEFRQAGTWGVLRLTLHPLNYTWEFLPVQGLLADAGSTPCR